MPGHSTSHLHKTLVIKHCIHGTSIAWARFHKIRSTKRIAMIEALFNQSNYSGVKKMLDGTVLRQKAIARNLANVETPNYKRVDISTNFQSELNKALRAKDIDRMESIRPNLVMDQKAVSMRGDGNTVQLERELMVMNQNSVSHAFQVQLVTGTLLKLRYAITGKK